MKKITIASIILVALSLITYKFRRLEPIQSITGKVRNFIFPATIVYYGDSITVWCKIPSISKNKSHHSFARNGFSTKDMFAIMNSYPKYENTKVFMLLGANDIRLKHSLKDIENYYRKIISRIRKSDPNSTLYIQPVFPVIENSNYPHITNERIREVNVLIQKIAKMENIQFLNTADQFKSKEGTLLKEYTMDGVHLKPNGCKKWYESLQPHL